ncbi:unnamed protein product [Ixodes persulcatus]
MLFISKVVKHTRSLESCNANPPLTCPWGSSRGPMP